MMTCICVKLVSDIHTNRFMKSHRAYFCVVLVLYLKTMSLNSLKIMKRSPIAEYSDLLRAGILTHSSFKEGMMEVSSMF